MRPPPSFIEAYSRNSGLGTSSGEEDSRDRVNLRPGNTSGHSGHSKATELNSTELNGAEVDAPLPGVKQLSISVNREELALLWSLITGIFVIVLVLVLLAYNFLFSGPQFRETMHSKLTSMSDISDPVDLADENLRGSLSLSWMSIGFRDKSVDSQWHDENLLSQQIQHRAAVLFFVTCIMMAFEALRILQCFCRKGRNYQVHIALACMHVVLMFLSNLCYRKPSGWLFWPVVFMLYFLIPATSLPPMTPSCSEMAAFATSSDICFTIFDEPYRCHDQAVLQVDCSPQGHTAVQMFMTWLLLQPWVLPQLEHMHMVWGWVLVVYPAWAFALRERSSVDKGREFEVFANEDCAFRVGLLSLALVVATAKKYAMEKSRRMKFLRELQLKASSFKIFHILEYMMPVHVIGPMLMDPNAHIADQVGRVSILFVLISEFDQFTRRMTPTELLKFLNEQFTRFDNICHENKVTKIETVGEEYVAAVGVLPKDIEENDRLGHGVLLERLFAAASEIMQLQNDEVKFKMGVHSGTIVAGVIGTKLPRYRLFGDTINSAARMMQKGIPGQLQFGAETHGDLPEGLKKQVQYRGEVEMKGKGKVKAWTFETAPGASVEISRPRIRSRSRKSLMETSSCVSDGSMMTCKDSRFESIVLQMDKDRVEQSRKRWVLSEREGFTDHLEREWFRWFHETVICHKIVRRFGTEAIMVLMLSAWELWYMMDIKAQDKWHPLYDGNKRLAVFVYCRGAVLLAAMLFWYFSEASRWIQNNPGSAQTLILASSSFALFCIYVSYDALVFSNTERWRNSVDFVHNYKAPDDQVYTLSFVLVVFLYIRQHALLFYPTLVLLPVALLLLAMPHAYNMYVEVNSQTSERYVESIFSFQGELLFILQAVIVVIVAHEDEQASRARFKVRHAVKQTQERTEGILDTLMPPLVVKGIRELPPNAPLPTHQYRHAMIAQSDLCGFTQLSANRRPTEVVKFMGDLFGAFDKLTDEHGVYKVETIGDAYIAGMAEQPLTETYSPYSVLLFGLDMVRAVDEWAGKMRVNVACRVGVAYGECIGGIVGTDMQRYHLFGDLLTVMDTLEATSIEGRMQISTACKQEVERQLREEAGEIRPEVLTFSKREEPNLKTSKGEVHEYSEVAGPTYLVNSSKPLRNKKDVYGRIG